MHRRGSTNRPLFEFHEKGPRAPQSVSHSPPEGHLLKAHARPPRGSCTVSRLFKTARNSPNDTVDAASARAASVQYSKRILRKARKTYDQVTSSMLLLTHVSRSGAKSSTRLSNRSIRASRLRTQPNVARSILRVSKGMRSDLNIDRICTKLRFILSKAIFNPDKLVPIRDQIRMKRRGPAESRKCWLGCSRVGHRVRQRDGAAVPASSQSAILQP